MVRLWPDHFLVGKKTTYCIIVHAYIYVDNKFYNEAYTSLYAGFNAIILHVYNSKELN